MKNKYIFFIAFWLMLSCKVGNHPKTSQRLVRLNGYAQGTTFSISYIARDSVFTMKNAMGLFGELDQSLSIYKKGSLINRFNESTEGVEADQHLKAVVLKAIETSKNSDGLFDITVYPLVKLWGFADKPREENLPDSATVTALLTCVGYKQLVLKGNFLQKKHPCIKIDVNGIAQGYSVDYFASRLEALGIRNYMVEIGGEIKAAGTNSFNKRKWTIAIEQPSGTDGDETFRARVQLQGTAITTSGNYRKYFAGQGRYISHLIDPRTGYSFTNDMISATVTAKNAITADAYDNVLMALGMKKAMEFVRAHKGLEAYLIYKKADGTVADTMTTGFSKLLLTGH